MRSRQIRLTVLLSAAIVAGAASLFHFRADGGRRTRARYLKYEYRIPMRDGVMLFTQVYLPRDKTNTYPFLVRRTPFGVSPYGPDRYRPQLGASPQFDRAGYIFVFQDVRGIAAESEDPNQLCDARYKPFVPEGTPYYGPGAEFVVFTGRVEPAIIRAALRRKAV